MSKPLQNELAKYCTNATFTQSIARALPKGFSAESFLRAAQTALLRNPQLNQCTAESFCGELLTLAQFGLTLNGRDAHLVPYKDKAKLVIDYKGLLTLAYRSGDVDSVHADVVREGDLFTYSLGEITSHVPHFLRRDADKPEDAGEVFAVYAMARMKTGSKAFAAMSLDDVNAIRDNSPAWRAFRSGAMKDSPWNPVNPVSENEMRKKTAFRRLCKIIPMSPELQRAIDVDQEEEYRELDVTPTAAGGELKKAKLEPRKKVEVEESPTIEAPPIETPQETPQARLEAMATEAGADWSKVEPVLIEANHIHADQCAGFKDVPDDVCEKVLSRKLGFQRMMKGVA